MNAKENFEIVRQELFDNCEIKPVAPPNSGGQKASVIRQQVSIKSKDLDIEIICGYSNRVANNRNLARLMMKRAIETIIE